MIDTGEPSTINGTGSNEPLFPILESNISKNLDAFIAFWSALYSYGMTDKYEKIKLKELTVPDLKNLYEWKNGMTLSGPKLLSLEAKVFSKIDHINKLKAQSTIDLDTFLEEFIEVSAVWKIFLLHIIKPKQYPIYDQHIHRAYLYIHNQPFDNITHKVTDNKKLNFYFQEYLPFVKASKIKDLKKMDEAFFAFGQFLNTRNQKRLMP